MNGNVIPAIIVQGGGFAINADRKIYKETTEKAADVGYDVLVVSVIDKYTYLFAKLAPYTDELL